VHYCTAVTQTMSSSHLQLKTAAFVITALATCSHLLLRTASAKIHFIITDCPLNQSLHRRQMGISSCCYKNLEQSDSVHQKTAFSLSVFRTCLKTHSLLIVISRSTVKCSHSDWLLWTLIIRSFNSTTHSDALA